MGSGMETATLVRRTLLGLAGSLLAAAAVLWCGRAPEVVAAIRRAMLAGGLGVVLGLVAAPVRANELGVPMSPGTLGVVIHDAQETLERYCLTDAEGRLWLQLPGGSRFELVTSTTDPAIANPGDGAFHPFDVAEIRSALAGVRYPIDGLAADVFVLPYPRRSGLESAAGPRVILLSPGVLPLSREHQHAELTHELGHVVQYARMADSDVAAWDLYRRMRGIVDESRYSATGAHADRPHEIFAEDFRALFGDALANYSGTIENATLEPPATVAGLPEFLRRLAPAPIAVSLAATPNPSRGAVTFARAGAVGAALDLFDAAGRRIATLNPMSSAGGVLWSWDGRDAAGQPLGAGVVFARERGAHGGQARITRLVPGR